MELTEVIGTSVTSNHAGITAPPSSKKINIKHTI
jgi:hypothetical protein